MSKKYLSSNNSSPKLPVWPAIWTATALKVFNAPEWLWGVMGVLYLLLTIAEIIKMATYEKIEL